MEDPRTLSGIPIMKQRSRKPRPRPKRGTIMNPCGMLCNFAKAAYQKQWEAPKRQHLLLSRDQVTLTISLLFMNVARPKNDLKNGLKLLGKRPQENNSQIESLPVGRHLVKENLQEQATALDDRGYLQAYDMYTNYQLKQTTRREPGHSVAIQCYQAHLTARR
jgi:hypothetical protein